jgi:dipeptidase E
MMPVIGIREGSALLLQNDTLVLKGELDGALFKGKSQNIIKPNQDLSMFLKL